MLENKDIKQYFLTVPAGKRLIAKAVASLKQIRNALLYRTVVIVSGTTNGYIAEEILSQIGQDKDGEFSKESFFRGANRAPYRKLEPGRFTGTDIVIEKGKWLKGITIHEAAPSLSKGDIIIKGANAVDSKRKLAGIQIGDSTVGTSVPILQAAIGRRTELIIPVGLEKRIFGDIGEIAARINSPSATGLRLLPIGGTIITELEAIEVLTGASAELVAAGGILGGEGGCWLAFTGSEDQLHTASELMQSVVSEPPFLS